jgi:hypothetical protein
MSVQLASKYDPTQPYHVYYDLDIINNATTGNNVPVRFSITDVRNSPFLNCPDNYFMSVVRFSLMTPTLPIFIPQVRIGQSNPNQLAYSFTLSNGTYTSAEVFIVYAPADLTQPTPNPPLTLQDMTSDYYFVNNLQDFVFMMNTAVSSAFSDLNAQIVASGGTVLTTIVPFFEWNPTNQVFILNGDTVAFNPTVASYYRLYCNQAMYTLINNFPFVKNTSSLPAKQRFQFNMAVNNNSNIFPYATYNAIQIYQDNSTVGLFNPVQSIVFTTSLLPIAQSIIGLPRIFNSVSSGFVSGNNSNIAPIITDFQVPFSAVNQYKPNLEYVPNGEYRLIDLYGMSPQSAMEVSVLWKDQFGGTHIFYLGDGCSGTMKLLFRRKDFGNVPRVD